MNSKKVGAVALSAVAFVVLVSGCAGVRSQVDAGSGQSSISEQADTQRREMAELRARQHATPLDASKLAANEAIRSDKQAAAKSSVSPNRVQEALRADKQASAQQKATANLGSAVNEAIRADKQASVSSGLSAAEAQGLRLTQQAEAYRAQVEKHALEQTAPEERRAQHPEQTTPPTEGAQDTFTDEERAAQHPQQEQR